MTPDPQHLTRRQALAAAGALGLGASAYGVLGCGGETATSTTATSTSNTATEAAAGGSCVLTPEQTEGPYYIEESLIRSDITEGREGTPLELQLTVQDATSCEPIADATVEVWHCDAVGVYSGFGDADGGEGGGGAPDRPPGDEAGDPPDGPPPGGDGGNEPTGDERFLRGGQRSDADGGVTFRTVYPGWYQGRTTHIHVKVHVSGDEVHTGQLYFDPSATESVYRAAPYADHGQPDMTNGDDGIYRDGGDRSLLTLSRAGEGYVGRLTLGVEA
jgi:protocatechuate 3,4-dioxygenase beta subunit